MGLMEQIEQIARELPESELTEVRDFAEFLRNRQRQATGMDNTGGETWQVFFGRHARTVRDAHPLGRDALYVECLS